ncbi:hypothetical protein AK812_SmicGene48880, partial [Symbiodinium microadriaticum]
ESWPSVLEHLQPHLLVSRSMGTIRRLASDAPRAQYSLVS